MCGFSDMRLATFVTNTDYSDFAMARPLDDEKFADLIALARPDWEVTAFWACKGVFPTDPTTFDGAMITGSPASVHDETPWMVALQAEIRRLVANGTPLFGACFGHQIIAKALGAPIVRNPGGWAHGLINMTRVSNPLWAGRQRQLSLYGSHIEQVAALPSGAVPVFQSPGCPIAGFAVGRTVFTVQHHPEMTKAFMADLIEEYEDVVGPEISDRARASLARGDADQHAFASEIAAFFEQGAR